MARPGRPRKYKNDPEKILFIKATEEQIRLLNTLLPHKYSIQPIEHHNNDGKDNEKLQIKKTSPLKKIQSKALRPKPLKQTSKHRELKNLEIKFEQQETAEEPHRLRSCKREAEVKIREDLSRLEASQEEVYIVEKEQSWEEECQKFIKSLMKHYSSWPFREPVDAEELGVPEYYEIVAEPMDLSTASKKLKNKQYNNQEHFLKDLRKMIQNSYNFNEGNSEYIKPTQTFEKYFNKLLATAHREKINKNKKNLLEQTQKKNNPLKKYSQKLVTLKEKQTLCLQMKKLSALQKQSVMKIAFGEKWREQILNLDTISVKKFREIERYMKIVTASSSIDEKTDSDEPQFNKNGIYEESQDQSSFLTDSSS